MPLLLALTYEAAILAYLLVRGVHHDARVDELERAADLGRVSVMQGERRKEKDRQRDRQTGRQVPVLSLYGIHSPTTPAAPFDP
jgi:hypothetical protein